MSVPDRSLLLEEQDPESGGTWTVFGDVALSLLLVMVLFILAQFLHYDNVVVLEEIDRRREEVAVLVREAAEEVLGAEGAGALEVVNQGFTAQRITFPEPMLFESCGTVPRLDGQVLIRAVGKAVGDRVGYFEAVQVEGHADRIPPTGRCQALVQDNWGLSSARATEFLRVLIGPEGFPNARVASAVGRGDTQPRSAPDAPRDALEADRRVELIFTFSEEAARQDLERSSLPAGADR